MTTYRDRFETYLKGLIAAGGEVSRIVWLVNAYEGTDPVARGREFDVWIDAGPFDCLQCGKAFWAAGVPHREDEEVLCPWCRDGSKNFAADPAWRARWRP